MRVQKMLTVLLLTHARQLKSMMTGKLHFFFYLVHHKETHEIIQFGKQSGHRDRR
jgi:hypothetical protein